MEYLLVESNVDVVCVVEAKVEKERFWPMNGKRKLFGEKASLIQYGYDGYKLEENLVRKR